MLRLSVILLWVVSAVLLFNGIPAAGADEDTASTQENSTAAVWSVYAQTGYQHIYLHFKAPFENSNILGLELFTRSPLELRLRNTDLWLGGIGASVQKNRFSAFVEGGGSQSRDARVVSNAEPFWAGDDHVDWKDCHVKWWNINGGIGMDVTDQFTIQAGFKYESLHSGLRDPVDRRGLIPNFNKIYGDRYEGRLESELLLPWIGVRFDTCRLSSYLRFSPYAYTDLKIPLTYHYIDTPITATEHQDYSFKHSGFWLEGNLAYDIFKNDNWCCTLWTQVSWLWTDGRTDSEYRAKIYNAGVQVGSIKDSASEKDSTYNTGNVATGLRVTYSF